jgi:Uma2 family endonuclease
VPDLPFCTVPPDWVCEILSPSTEAFDRARKLAVYAREAVRHAWLIDPVARTLEVLTLQSSRWVIAATHLGAETVRAEPFADVELPLAALWAEE